MEDDEIRLRLVEMFGGDVFGDAVMHGRTDDFKRGINSLLEFIKTGGFTVCEPKQD